MCRDRSSALVQARKTSWGGISMEQRPGQNPPMQYFFWSMNDMVDNDYDITGLPRAMQKIGEHHK
eukprot:4833809-Pyramimonas_sp.AAC.1